MQLRPTVSGGGICFISMKWVLNQYGTVEIRLYSRYAIIDKTGDLHMSVRSFQGSDKTEQVVNSLLSLESKAPLKPQNLETLSILRSPQPSYAFVTSRLGSPVYIDELHTWTHLPNALSGIGLLMCFNEDSTQTGKDVVQFQVKF